MRARGHPQPGHVLADILHVAGSSSVSWALVGLSESCEQDSGNDRGGGREKEDRQDGNLVAGSLNFISGLRTACLNHHSALNFEILSRPVWSDGTRTGTRNFICYDRSMSCAGMQCEGNSFACTAAAEVRKLLSRLPFRATGPAASLSGSQSQRLRATGVSISFRRALPERELVSAYSSLRHSQHGRLGSRRRRLGSPGSSSRAFRRPRATSAHLFGGKQSTFFGRGRDPPSEKSAYQRPTNVASTFAACARARSRAHPRTLDHPFGHVARRRGQFRLQPLEKTTCAGSEAASEDCFLGCKTYQIQSKQSNAGPFLTSH